MVCLESGGSSNTSNPNGITQWYWHRLGCWVRGSKWWFLWALWLNSFVNSHAESVVDSAAMCVLPGCCRVLTLSFGGMVVLLDLFVASTTGARTKTTVSKNEELKTPEKIYKIQSCRQPTSKSCKISKLKNKVRLIASKNVLRALAKQFAQFMEREPRHCTHTVL